jgi:NADH dehydrogenase
MTVTSTVGGIFITGGSGFVGSQLLERLGEISLQPIYCLTRQPDNIIKESLGRNHIEIIKGDLFDVETYSAYLARCDTVIHLAAVTGKAGREAYFRVNSEGTKVLIEACEKAGVKNFLYVSTIAVTYPDKSRYYYAQSKEQAENTVMNSSLNYTIIRPTIVIGKDSAIWKSLSGLASGTIIPMFGDGTTKIQPIYVDDLVGCMLGILKEKEYQGQVLELGGPEITSFDQFASSIHNARTSNQARFIHLPLKPITMILSMLENFAYSLLPVTVGQLSAFGNNGTIQMNKLFNNNSATMKGVKEMVELVISQESSAAIEKRLRRECILISRYLIGQPPSVYVIEKYIEAHKYSEMVDASNQMPFERFLLQIATRNVFLLKIVDAYSAFFTPSSVLRNKLILLVAIMESCAPSYREFEAHETSPIIQILLELAWKGIVFAVSFALALLTLLPIQIIFAARAKLMGERR